MEMVSIPLEQYQEFLQVRLELNLIYTKYRKDGAYAAGIFIGDMMKMLHPDLMPEPSAQSPAVMLKVPEVTPDAEQL